MPTPLNRMLEDRSNSRFMRAFAEQARTMPNSYCQLQAIDGKECIIDGKKLLNFNAINYLGLEKHPRLIEAAQQAIANWGTLAGSARSAAEVDLFASLENRIAGWLGVDNVIVYTTVTLANHGIIPLLMRQGSLLLMDREAHNSVQRAGIEAKGGGAKLVPFDHDDFRELEGQLSAHRGRHDHALIALDGVYSMSGSFLKLPRYQELADRYGATLYVDDAHGFGVVGPGGRGIVSHFEANYDNTIYVASLEKGLASLGGFAVVPKAFRDYFLFNSYTYIYGGQLPAPYLASALAAFDVLDTEGAQRRSRLYGHIARVKQGLQEMGFEISDEEQPFPLIMVKVGELQEAARVSQFFYDEGIHILTVGFPVVPKSRGLMLRISLSASHTEAQVDRLLAVFRKFRSQSARNPHQGPPRPEVNMTAIKTRAVSSRLEWRRFLRFPRELYDDEPRWVPPLARDEEQRVGFRRHPFHDENRVQAFLAERDGRVVGRIAAIHNVRHNRQLDERRGFFGFFECRDDRAAARALLGAAADCLLARGLTDLRGPMNPSIEYQAGLLVDGFDEPPSFMMPYNPSYYDNLLVDCGLAKSQDLFALACTGQEASLALPRLERVKQRLMDRYPLRFRALCRRRFRQDLDVFLSVVNRSLVGHWGHVPLSTAEMNHMAAGLRWLLVPELAVLAELDGQPVGVALALPDYNARVRCIRGRLLPFGFMRLLAGKRRIKRLRVMGLNVLPEWKRSGLGVALTATILEAALRRGTESLEFSWIAESNDLSHGTLETGGAQRSKTYRIYDAPLSS